MRTQQRSLRSTNAMPTLSAWWSDSTRAARSATHGSGPACSATSRRSLPSNAFIWVLVTWSSLIHKCSLEGTWLVRLRAPEESSKRDISANPCHIFSVAEYNECQEVTFASYPTHG